MPRLQRDSHSQLLNAGRRFRIDQDYSNRELFGRVWFAERVGDDAGENTTRADVVSSDCISHHVVLRQFECRSPSIVLSNFLGRWAVIDFLHLSLASDFGLRLNPDTPRASPGGTATRVRILLRRFSRPSPEGRQFQESRAAAQRLPRK